ncbi:choice-of-anchor B family protein [Crocinitomix algicola]|uniref:choice-of-anchor B family protein n=1 Tax=Crocinitomix algicola TaxID=1740263 RepID=UPI000872CE5F|nr:choice-of-anchor B family protein [Crocinitomix algicola]
MFRFFLPALILSLSLTAFGQLNIEEVGRIDIPSLHETGLNDVWGYVDELGNEYALVGAEDGVSIVDVSNPTDPLEVFWVEGLNSIWRDLKTYEDVLYVTTEALQGLMIIDLSGLPEDTDLPVTIYNGPIGDEWESAHNLYQRDGYIYIFGAGRDNGGVIILDVHTDPLNPTEVGVFDNWYAHDGYVQNDTGYFAHIYDGFFSVVDLSDKSSPELLGTAITPTNFAHNIWASEDGDYVFTTDEVADGFIGAFDVSDPESIKELDRIQSSPGNDIVPHNSHVKGNFLYTSYYTDGLVVHDVSRPHNLIEVANFDTSPLDAPTTEGCWGAYPFLPSGLILATDRQEGLYILDVNEQQGSYIEGNITEFGTDMPLNGVEVTIEGTLINDRSNVIGDYATGIEAEGTVDVNYFKVLYFPQTIEVPIVNGEVTVQDVVLEKIPEFEVNVKVLDANTLMPVAGANVRFEHTYINATGITDESGEVSIPLYYQDNYQVFSGKWGFTTSCFVDTMITDETTELILYIEEGIYDDFTFDYGWSTGGSAARGFWEREKPVGVDNGDGMLQNPAADMLSDCGNMAFMTGNGTTVTNVEEVNDGEVFLLSPIFDLTGYENPHINYAAWFFCMHGATPNDTMEVYVLNGIGDFVLIDQHYNGGLPMGQWNGVSVAVEPLIELTETMQILVLLSDYVESENVTEGGLDNFSVTEFSMLNVDDQKSFNQDVYIYPNPFQETIHIQGVDDGQLDIYDVSGRKINSLAVQPQISLTGLDKGTYFFVVSTKEGQRIKTFTQIKY